MGVLKNEMVLKWLEVSCTCFKWTVCVPNDVYVLEMTGTCWKWPVCIKNDPYVSEMMHTYLKWSVRIGICWEWPVCIENDPYVLEMTCTYLKMTHTYWKWRVWSVYIQNGWKMNCTYWWDCRKSLNGWKWFILMWLSIMMLNRVQPDPYRKFGLKNNARVIRLGNRVRASDQSQWFGLDCLGWEHKLLGKYILLRMLIGCNK